MSQAERAESIDEQEHSRADGDKKSKSRRPASAHPLFRHSRPISIFQLIHSIYQIPLFGSRD